MLFSYNWLQEYIKEKLQKPEKLANLLNMHAFEVEKIKKVKNDWIFDIAVLPNRAHDCMCHLGMAREIAAIGKFKLQTPKAKKVKILKGQIKPMNVCLQPPELVPRYLALVVEQVKVGKSPKLVADRLEALGINTINTIVDLTNYVMLETGQPLHAFDYDKIKGQTMTIRQAKKGEKIETLDNQVWELPEGALVIEDAEGLIDLAGIKGGKESAISSDTKNILLQAANFDGATIYRTKKQLGYTTQAADIYAHQIDPNLAMEALERANALLSELGIGGTIAQCIDIYPKKIVPKKIPLDVAYVEQLLGVHMPKKEIWRILQRLGFRGTKVIAVPTRRIDVSIPEDLAEEIGRIYGYEKILPAAPYAPILPPERNASIFWQEMLRDALTVAGFLEVYNYSFIGEKDLAQFDFSQAERKELAALQNPISEDFKYPRNSLLENLLKNAAFNQRHEEDIRIFEIGKVFQKTEKGIREENMLGGIISTSRASGFYDAKGVIDFALNRLGIGEVWYDEYQPTPDKSRQTLWQKGKSAEVKVGNKEIGFLGEISKQITSNLKIKQNIAAFSINIVQAIQLAEEEKEYRPISKFPSSIRDIAIFVSKDTKVADVLNIISETGGSLVNDVDLFDMYEGEEIGEGRKNLAFHVVYQADNRTLTSKEIDALHEKIIKAVEENPEWEVRK